MDEEQDPRIPTGPTKLAETNLNPVSDYLHSSFFDIWNPVSIGSASSLERPKSNSRVWEDYFSNEYSNAQNMALPQFNTANQDQARLQQQAVIQQLQQQAAGGPLSEPLQQQLRQGYNQASAQQSSLGSTVRGQSAGAAMRGTQARQGQLQRGFAGDQAELQAQQQQAAQALLGQLLAQQRDQDIQGAQMAADGTLRGRGTVDDYMRSVLGAGLDVTSGDRQRLIDSVRSSMGFEDRDKLPASAYSGLINAGRGLTNGITQTATRMINSGNSDNSASAYRQVDNQDSIVPYDDK